MPLWGPGGRNFSLFKCSGMSGLRRARILSNHVSTTSPGPYIQRRVADLPLRLIPVDLFKVPCGQKPSCGSRPIFYDSSNIREEWWKELKPAQSIMKYLLSLSKSQRNVYRIPLRAFVFIIF
ncbi:hypothetical protein AB1N83_013246 [Pleurotus pulmonarius]